MYSWIFAGPSSMTGPWAGIDAPDAERLHAAERRHVVGEVAVLVGDHAGGAVQDQVAAEERALFLEVIAEVVGGVPRRVDGDERHAVALHHLSVSEIGGALGQIGVLVDHLRDGQPGEALAQVRHAAQVVAVPVGQDHARGLAPAALAEIAPRSTPMYPATPAPVSIRIGIAPPDQVGVGAGARHHARVEPEHAPDAIARRGALGKVRIDPAHADLRHATPR